MGASAIMYSLYEGVADSFELDAYTGPIQPPAPLFAGMMTGATYYMRAGPRVAALAGTIGLGAVGGTFALYSVLGIPYGSNAEMLRWNNTIVWDNKEQGCHLRAADKR
eukprot:scaffold11236_cov82-Skeletonema_dohrnii-CCMP3373.AAC.1